MVKIKRVFKVVAIALAVLLFLFFLLRNGLLGWAVEKVGSKIKEKTGCTLAVGDKGFTGLATVTLDKVLVLAPEQDTLLFIDKIAVRPSLLPMIVGRLQLSKVAVDRALLRLQCVNGRCNYSGWLKNLNDSSAAESTRSTDGSDLARKVRSTLIRVFDLAPQEAELHDLRLQLRSDTLNADLAVTEFVATADELHGTLIDQSAGASWKMLGSFHQRKRAFDVTVYPMTGQHRLPLLQPLIGATMGFDSLHVVLNGLEGDRKEVQLRGLVDLEGGFGYHAKIASDTVRINHARFEYSVLIDQNSVTLDSTTFAEVNRLTIRPYVKYDKSSSTVYSLRVKTDTSATNDFFGSLPEGMFDEVRSIRGDGKLSFSLIFELNSARPDQVLFDCSMKRIGFRVRDFGSTGIPKLNGEFVHDVFEKDRLVRSFAVGPSNPDYTTMDQVSPYFRNAVLTSEDGSFFFHNGFNEEAFRKSIAANYRAGKFVRGGSTITMQLVKNVFLTRKKTVARKAEEALIVWLIESGRLISKERMLEVYFNIIELGPGVYGIGEASRFYFDKKPSQIDLQEGIFLAGLLPRPKAFRFQFDSEAVLKPYLADYFRIMTNFMLKKELITQQEYDAVVPNVTLKGPALEMVLPKDTAEVPAE